MQKSLLKLLIVGVLASLVLAAGCARRTNPASSVVTGESSSISTFTHAYGPPEMGVPGLLPANGLGLTLTESPTRTSKTYRPPGYRARGLGRPYPVLFLLLDFGGNGETKDVTDNYYFEIGLQRLADSLINAGIIKPMIIATVDLYNAYGGSWYTSNSIQGMYDACLMDFVGYVDRELNVSVHNGRLSHAVSGVGMGGYGAIMSAIRHPGDFSSASSVNGYLAFTAESAKHNYQGIKEWIPQVFDENIVTALSPSTPATDPAILPYYLMAPDINRPLRKPFTSLMFSMAAAFSPYDPATATSMDEMTWMNPSNAGGIEFDRKVTLPFDFYGELWPHTWAKWRANDPSRILFDNPVALVEVEVLVLAGTSGRFNTLQQNRIFHDVAMQRGASTIRYQEYEGYGDYETTGRNYLNEVLRDVLKFHSDQFTADPFTLE